MGKMTFVVGVGIGFVLGSRAGRQTYDQMEAKVRDLAGRPEVHEAVDTAKSGAAAAAHSVADRLPGFSSGAAAETSAPPSDPRPDHYADPQDLQFGKAAADKEDRLDAMLAAGASVQEVQAQEDVVTPRAANKAEPPDGGG